MALFVLRPTAVLSAPLLISSWLILAVPVAQAQPLVQLTPSTSAGFYQPDERLHLFVPDNARPDEPGTLTLELDGMDVTALTEMHDGELIYTPVRPLKPGEHQLRVVFYGEQGRVQELGHWRFEVRQSRRFQELEARGQLDLALSQRLTQHNQGGGNDFSVQGGGHLQAQASGDNWRLDSSLDLMAVNDTELAIAGRELDLARFSLRGEYDRYRLALGDQQLASASLIQDGFERRGISTGARLPVMGGALSLYRADSQQQVGIDAGLGGDEADSRLTGGRLEFWPLRSANAQLLVAGEQLSGRVSTPDYGSFDPNAAPTVHRGEARNLTLDGLFFRRQLRLRYETAESEYDFDGRDGDLAPERDNAWSALAVVDPTPMADLNWRLGWQSTKMGTWYKSLANRYAPADKRMDRVFFDVSKNQWSWEGGYAIEDNNLAEDSAYATSETRQWNLSTHYAEYDVPEGPILDFLGQPSYHLSARGTTLEDSYTPEGYLANDLETRHYGLTAAFTKTQLQWSVGYHYDTLEDATGWQPEARTQATRLEAGWLPNRRYRLFASWQLQHTTYPTLDASTYRHLYAFDAQAELIPGRLQTGLTMSLNQTHAREDPFFAQRGEDAYMSAHLNWRLRDPDPHFGGLDLRLSVTRNRYLEQLAFTDTVEGYQAFIELRSQWPLAYPGGQP
ncbi:hypothetical protein [Marinimicrobium alkaliphilum]|uniref:hypothetical protein n=1 Tax=Marinimicrobium alkaliphilum TaxID=2202654 RepID=UPI000DB9CF0A|nr:hypothetical protein [Marinimicrobium alkaliphilum]